MKFVVPTPITYRKRHPYGGLSDHLIRKCRLVLEISFGMYFLHQKLRIYFIVRRILDFGKSMEGKRFTHYVSKKCKY
jgi:hypothetical protein